MDRLSTSRVVVIDDNKDEAMPMILALGRLGLGCIHLSGVKAEELPKRPYRGIRLAFVDMDLDIGGGGGAKAVVAKTVAVVKTVIAPDSSPCIFVAWTKHADYMQEFCSVLPVELPCLVPHIVVQMEKPLDPDDIKINEIVARLRGLLKEHWPIEAIWTWEQLVHEAITDTTAVVARVATEQVDQAGAVPGSNQRVGEWETALQSVLSGLVHASGGNTVRDRLASPSLLETMNCVLMDSMEKYAARMDACGARRFGQGPSLSERGKVQLNTKLLIGSIRDGDTALRPGNVYTTSTGSGTRHPIPRLEVSPAAVLEDFSPKWTKDKAFRDQSDAAGRTPRNSADRERIRQARSAMERIRRELAAKCRVALVEVTPACDFAQGKSCVARFVGGILVPEDVSKCFAECKAPYFRREKAVIIDGKAWELVLNAHFVYSRRMPVRGARRARFRLRQSVVADIQHWLATQASRPGIIAVD